MKIIFKIIKTGSGNDIYFERLAEELKKYNKESHIEYYPKLFQYIPWALKFFNKKSSADIIHSNVEYGWVFKEKNKPLYITLHHNVFSKEYRRYTTLLQKCFHDFILKPNIKKSLNTATRIIAVSQYTKDSFKQYFGDYPIEVIYNFINTGKFKPMKIHQANKKFKLLFVGNLTKRKGADLLPQIMNQLGNEYVLSYTSGLRTKIPKHFNSSNMIPLGKLSEQQLIIEYNKCDALLFPTRLEGFGYAAAEAMACGKPVITSKNSSMPEIVIDKQNGFLCEVDNVSCFVNCVKNLKNSNINNYLEINRQQIIHKFNHLNNSYFNEKHN